MGDQSGRHLQGMGDMQCGESGICPGNGKGRHAERGDLAPFHHSPNDQQ
jgi:hypothetical protein